MQFKSLPNIIKKSKGPIARPQPKRKPAPSLDDSDFTGGSVRGTKRKSARLQDKVKVIRKKIALK